MGELDQIRIDIGQLNQKMTAVETQVKMLNPLAIIEFKATALKALKQIDDDIVELVDKVGTIGDNMLVLKTKMGIWGALAGAIMAAAITLLPKLWEN